MPPSLTRGDSSWAGHVGRGPGALWCWLGARTATICPLHRRDLGPVAMLPKVLYFSSEKGDVPSHNWQWASAQLLAGRTWSCGDAMCQPNAPWPVRVGEKEVPFPGSVWQGLPVEWGRAWGRCEGGWQNKPWEEMLWVYACWDACLLREGEIQQGAQGCGEHPCASMDTAPWAHADSSSKVDTGSFFLQQKWVNFLSFDDLIRPVKYRRKQKGDEWCVKKRELKQLKIFTNWKCLKVLVKQLMFWRRPWEVLRSTVVSPLISCSK